MLVSCVQHVSHHFAQKNTRNARDAQHVITATRKYRKVHWNGGHNVKLIQHSNIHHRNCSSCNLLKLSLIKGMCQSIAAAKALLLR